MHLDGDDKSRGSARIMRTNVGLSDNKDKIAADVHNGDAGKAAMITMTAVMMTMTAMQCCRQQ